MNSRVQQTGAAVLTGLLALDGVAPTARAAPFRPFLPTPPAVPINPNFQVAPGLSLRQSAFNTAVVGRAVSNIPPFALGFNPFTSPIINSSPVVNTGGFPSFGGGFGSSALSTFGGTAGFGAGGFPSSATLSTGGYGSGGYGSGGYGSGGYGSGGYGSGGYGEDPTAGFLRGTADVINATGNYYKNVQSARLTQSQADESRIDYRRRLIDEAHYERMDLMTTEELRQQQLARDLARSRHEPPIEEISLRASPLNDLLHHLTSDSGPDEGAERPSGRRGYATDQRDQPDPDDHQRRPAQGRGGTLQWPQALKGA